MSGEPSRRRRESRGDHLLGRGLAVAAGHTDPAHDRRACGESRSRSAPDAAVVSSTRISAGGARPVRIGLTLDDGHGGPRPVGVGQEVSGRLCRSPSGRRSCTAARACACRCRTSRPGVSGSPRRSSPPTPSANSEQSKRRQLAPPLQPRTLQGLLDHAIGRRKVVRGADPLAGLVPLPRHDDDVSRAGLPDGGEDRLAPVLHAPATFLRTRRRRPRPRRSRPGSATGSSPRGLSEVSTIASACSAATLPHRGALGGVATAAATEDDPQAAPASRRATRPTAPSSAAGVCA